VPRAAVTEAFTWIGTALGLGVAVGAGLSGKLVDVFGANSAFSVATAAAGIAAVTVGTFRSTLRVPAEHVGSPLLTR
jgi:MFS family permease